MMIGLSSWKLYIFVEDRKRRIVVWFWNLKSSVKVRMQRGEFFGCL